MKIYKNKSHFFSNGVARARRAGLRSAYEYNENCFSKSNTWNSLPEEVIPVKTVKHFEIMLDNHWKYRTLAST